MIFQIFLIMLKFVSNAGDFGDIADGSGKKAYIISQNTIYNASGTVDRIRISKNPDYIDLADYLVLTRGDRLGKSSNDSSNLNKNLQKVKITHSEYDEGIEKNRDFYYNEGFYMLKSDWFVMRGVMKEDWSAVINGYQNVCKKVKTQPSSLHVKSLLVQVGDIGNLKEICDDVKKLLGSSNEKISEYFVRNFVPYMIGDDDGGIASGIFTGYYYPMLNASRKRSSVYRYPIYKKPNDLAALSYSREDIANGVLFGKGLEIFWVNDAVDLFFLHIQGSGLLKLAEGGYTNVRFAAKNSQPYASIGKYMVDMRYVKRGQDAREFLRNNPKMANEVMNVNKSYIFFEESSNDEVVGAHGSELVDGRSLAVDSRFIPYGLMVYVDTPERSRVMFTQDTGSAIKGKIRGDIFVGKGFNAGEEAKRIYAKGFMYILVHKNQKVTVL